MLHKKKSIFQDPPYEEMKVTVPQISKALFDDEERIIVEYKKKSHADYNKECVDMSIINTNSIVRNGSFISGDVDMNLHDPVDIDNVTSIGVNSILQNSSFVNEVNDLNE